jgi:hypothetical protein
MRMNGVTLYSGAEVRAARQETTRTAKSRDDWYVTYMFLPHGMNDGCLSVKQVN